MKVRVLRVRKDEELGNYPVDESKTLATAAVTGRTTEIIEKKMAKAVKRLCSEVSVELPEDTEIQHIIDDMLYEPDGYTIPDEDAEENGGLIHLIATDAEFVM